MVMGHDVMEFENSKERYYRLHYITMRGMGKTESSLKRRRPEGIKNRLKTYRTNVEKARVHARCVIVCQGLQRFGLLRQARQIP